MRVTKAGQVIGQVLIIVIRYLLGRSGRRGTAETADPSVTGPVTRVQ